MSTRSWIGGGADNIYAPADWSPAGRPQPGDSLFMVSGVANMRGGNLAGDTLTIGEQTSYTSPPPATINLSHHASLSAVVADTAYTEQQVNFNVSGTATLNLEEQANYYATTTVAVNIAAQSTLKGTIVGQGHNADITVTGADATSRFANTGASSISNGVLTINADVAGTGSFTASFYGGLAFMGSVSAGQTVNSGGEDTITIAQPEQFRALVNFAGGPSNTVHLAGITDADSYSYKNDILSLFHGAQVVDTLRFAAGANPFQVNEGSTGVYIGSTGEPPPVSGTIVLPQHI